MPRAGICLVVRREGNHYYTARDVICLVLCRWGVSLTRPVLESVSSFVSMAVSLTRPVLQSVSSLSGSGVSLTRPVLESVSSFVWWGIFLTRPVLVCLVFRLCEFLLHTA